MMCYTHIRVQLRKCNVVYICFQSQVTEVSVCVIVIDGFIRRPEKCLKSHVRCQRLQTLAVAAEMKGELRRGERRWRKVPGAYQVAAGIAAVKLRSGSGQQGGRLTLVTKSMQTAG